MQNETNNLSCVLLRFLSSEDGPTTVEYAVILAVIVATIILSLTVLGDGMSTTFQFIADALS